MIVRSIRQGFSSYLSALYQASREAETPFFAVDSNRIQILEDPLDFYVHLNNSVRQSSQRIGLSALYLGTGALERHLLANIAARHRLCPQMVSAMVFDHHRSQREEKGESPHNILTRFADEFGGKARVGFQRIGRGKGILGEVQGVHHQKMYLFDDRVIIGGANLSHNYFLNRKDRYLSIQSPELSDYLFDYLQILAAQPTPEQLQTHHRLWKYAYMPEDYMPSFHQQRQALAENDRQRQAEKARTFQWDRQVTRQPVLARNARIAASIGTSLIHSDPIAPLQHQRRRQAVRDRLFSVKSEDYVGNELQQVEDPLGEPPVASGKEVYIFPFMQWGLLGETRECDLFSRTLRTAAKEGHLVRMASGYLNPDQALFAELAKEAKLEPAVKMICSAPTANSFYGAKGAKGYIPSMYRCFQYQLLKQMGNKLHLREFDNGEWSFHAKGLWLDTGSSFLTVVGSSNFNQRSKTRDSQLQLYLHSDCPSLNARLNKQWTAMEEQSRQVSTSDIQSDEDTKAGRVLQGVSRLFSSVL